MPNDVHSFSSVCVQFGFEQIGALTIDIKSKYLRDPIPFE